MIRGFKANREERIPVSVRLSTSSKNIVDVATEAINAKFEEHHIESKVTLTDVFEEIISSSVGNMQNVLQIDDQFYSISEILMSYLNKKFDVNHIGAIISKRELIRELRSNNRDIQKYFLKNMISMDKNNKKEYKCENEIFKYSEKELYDWYKSFLLEPIEDEKTSRVRNFIETKAKKEILSIIFSLERFKGVDVFLKLNKQKEIQWYIVLNDIIDKFIKIYLINDQDKIFNNYLDKVYNVVLED